MMRAARKVGFEISNSRFACSHVNVFCAMTQVDAHAPRHVASNKRRIQRRILWLPM
jgi:hypothetical protein